MNKKFTKLIAALALLAFMTPTMAGWGQSRETKTYKLTIKCDNFNTTSYEANNNEKTSYAINTSDNTDTYEVKWTSYQVMKNSNNMQWQKSKGSIYNSTNLGTITNVTVTSTAGSFTTYYGTSAQPSSSTTVGGGFFQTKVGSETGTTSKLEVTFQIESSNAVATTTTIDASGITNTNKYVSTEAGSLSASVTYGDPATAVPNATVTWSGDNDDVATINETTGEVTLVAAGTVTFTASYEGNNDYNASSATYEMTVTNENPSLTTIWSEDFATEGYSDRSTTYSYATTGNSAVQNNDNYAGGTAPEMMVKGNGTFSATIPLLTSTYCYNGDLTLTYKTNANALNVKTTTTGLTVDGEESAGAGLTFSTKETHTITFKGVTTSTENITIVFTAGSSNVRLDDIVLKGEQAPLTTVATPVISPDGGAVVSGTEVTITCATEGASIYYTTDGSTPTSSSTLYNPSSKPTITTAMTLKAIAVKADMDDSNVAEAAYTIKYTLTVNIEHVEYGLYDYTTGEWNDIEVDSENHALVPQGAEVRISPETIEDCYTLNGFDVTYGSTTIHATDHMAEDGTYGFTMPASDASLAEVVTQAQERTLFLGELSHVTLALMSGEANDVVFTNNVATLCEGINVTVIVTVEEGYVMGSVSVVDANDQPVEVTYQGVSIEDGKPVYSFTMPAANATITATATLPPTYSLVTSIGDLVSGKHYIIASGTSGENVKAMGSQASNNRPAVAVTVNNDNKIVYNENVYEFVINGPEMITKDNQQVEVYTIYDVSNNAYLYAAGTTGSNNKNYLKTQPFNDANGQWTIVFVENKANITAQGNNLCNKMRYNSSSTLFSCYSSGQSDIYLYVKDDDTNYEFYKDIAAHTEATGLGNTDGWYFIASPINSNLAPSAVNNMLTEETTAPYSYDLYRLNGTIWENYHQHTDFSIDNGKGYLYASATAKTLRFSGNSTKTYSTDDNNVTPTGAGWNLIGNPYTFPVRVSRAFSELNNGSAITNKDANSIINPGTGIAVYGTDDVTFTKYEPAVQSSIPNNLNLILSQQATNRGNASNLDNAIVSFNEGSQLPKFYFGEQNANLYIPQGTEEYAIAYSIGQGEMPVNFRANENGQYTLTVNPENVEMNYLHLIDNMTGTDIDLLATPSYTFNAKTTDYESRFKLVFASNTAIEDNSNETFAFFANGQLIVSNEGEATLQVIDMMGRILNSETVNGSVSKAINQPAGIYMIRLINGNDVKVQKMIVR